MCCSVIWKPFLIKHVQMLEHVQRCAKHYILNDYLSNYKSRLTKLQMLPLMYILEFDNIHFSYAISSILMKGFTLIVMFLLPQEILMQQT